VILSDHGQTLGATFLQRYGKKLEEVIRQLMGGADSVDAAIDDLEQWRVLNSFVSELSHARGTSTVTRTALQRRARRRQQRKAKGSASVAPEPSPDRPDVIVCPSGNLSLIYFPTSTAVPTSRRSTPVSRRWSRRSPATRESGSCWSALLSMVRW